jgi:hypothetical protein
MGLVSAARSMVGRRRARRITDLLPRLMEEFNAERPPLEVLDCADAVVAYYEERSGHVPALRMARERTRECLRAGVCEGLHTADPVDRHQGGGGR